jgi:hypothetical protein
MSEGLNETKLSPNVESFLNSSVLISGNNSERVQLIGNFLKNATEKEFQELKILARSCFSDLDTLFLIEEYKLNPVSKNNKWLTFLGGLGLFSLLSSHVQKYMGTELSFPIEDLNDLGNKLLVASVSWLISVYGSAIIQKIPRLIFAYVSNLKETEKKRILERVKELSIVISKK